FRGVFSYCARGGECAAIRNRSPHWLTVFARIPRLLGSWFNLFPSAAAFSRPIHGRPELGQDSFLTSANEPLIKPHPRTNHRGRRHDLGDGELVAHFHQRFPPPHERFPHQTPPGMVQQVKHHILHRTPKAGLTDSPPPAMPWIISIAM